jgi:hypothetical protein
MRTTRIYPAAMCIGVALGLGGPSLAAAAPATPALKSAVQTDVLQVSERSRRHHHRHYGNGVPVYPQVRLDTPRSYNPWNPDRGYYDPGFAYHGNINGCAEDLGYGRWESCSGPSGGGGMR